MNIEILLKKGQEGKNRGIPLAKGIKNLSDDIGGIQRAKSIIIAGAPKSGKTTFVDANFVYSTYLYTLANPNLKVNLIYFCWEETRLSKELNALCYFLHEDFGIDKIPLKQGRFYKEKNYVELCPKYLKGVLVDQNDKIIKLHPKVLEKIDVTIEKRIKPLFGTFDERGRLIKKGFITLITKSGTPTEVYETLLNKASREGELKTDSKNRIIHYVPNNPEIINLIIFDHVRKSNREKGDDEKRTVDKLSNYINLLRDGIGYTFVSIVHMNRDAANVGRLRLMGDRLFPNSDSIKSTGNLTEDCDIAISILDPNDQAYNLTVHFALTIRDDNGDPIYPNRRTAHILVNRDGDIGHYAFNFHGNIKHIKQFKK